jgi:hypothetical protein
MGVGLAVLFELDAFLGMTAVLARFAGRGLSLRGGMARLCFRQLHMCRDARRNGGVTAASDLHRLVILVQLPLSFVY